MTHTKEAENATSAQAQETLSVEKPHVEDIKEASTPSVASDTIDKAEVPAGSTDDDQANYPHGLKLVTLIIALCLAVFLVALDQTIIATAIPRITDRFRSIDDIGWYGSAYFLTSTALQPTFGRIYKVFTVGLLLPVHDYGCKACLTHLDAR